MPKRLIFYFTDKSYFKTIEIFYLQCLVFNYNLVKFIFRYFISSISQTLLSVLAEYYLKNVFAVSGKIYF